LSRSSSVLGGSESFYRLIRLALLICYKACFRIRFYGTGHVPDARDDRGVILAPNHASYLDPPIMGIALQRRVTYLAKDYLFKHWLVGGVLKNIGAYPIKSDTGNDFKSIRDLIRILKHGACVTVFPEGTRSETGNFKEPEPGIGFLAIKSRAWVVPVYIEGSFEAFPKGAKGFKCKPIHVFFGKPFVPSLDAELLAAGEAAYAAVSQKIMLEIRALKENALDTKRK
jgi:1-acyl-sn-glycerol-3-phosphate acyltransferase